MSTVSTRYTSRAMADLCESYKYEAWLLEEIYKIVDLRLEHDAIAYPPDGTQPSYTQKWDCAAQLYDWRPSFLNVGTPLVFVTEFKLLDMLLEWVLAQNGIPRTFRFEQKIKALKGTVVIFPPLIEARLWLRERLISLYEQLEPLRGTIIHARNFKAENGNSTFADKFQTVMP